MNYSDKLKEIKTRIKAKFRTLRNFSAASGIAYTDMNKFFGRKMAKLKVDDFAKLLNEKLDVTEFTEGEKYILPVDREYVRAKIAVNYRNYNNFIADNPMFSKSFVSNVINGKRMRNDDRYQRLKDALSSLEYSPERF